MPLSGALNSGLSSDVKVGAMSNISVVWVCVICSVVSDVIVSDSSDVSSTVFSVAVYQRNSDMIQNLY